MSDSATRSAAPLNGTHIESLSTIPYTSAAAGHQGIATDPTGAMLIKPCTQAEIDFYESAKAHPAFQAHMPVYMGQVSLADEKDQSKAKQLMQQQQSEIINTPKSASSTPIPIAGAPQRDTFQSSARSSTSTHRRVDSGHIISDPLIARSARKEWTPSGGAKLDSNLSIVLSNATAGFRKPNVIDLKLGARLWDDDAPAAKRKKLDEVSAATTSSSLGFRVAGMKVYVGDESNSEVTREVNTEVADGYKTYNKFYGRDGITKENVKSAFDAFFWSLDLLSNAADKQGRRKQLLKRKLLVEMLLREVSSIEYVFLNEESRMYSASVLMVYEGDPEALDSVITFKTQNDQIVSAEVIESQEEDEEDRTGDEDDEDDDETPKQKIEEVVLIDFAHAHWTPGQGPDENVLHGVRSIKKTLEDILHDTEEKLKS
ncbi:hypothetical protein LTS08_002864 [Lithohypha guttulata]|nr:hypothetical protein LTS08_002864 [Lithohypha guttulata]